MKWISVKDSLPFGDLELPTENFSKEISPLEHHLILLMRESTNNTGDSSYVMEAKAVAKFMEEIAFRSFLQGFQDRVDFKVWWNKNFNHVQQEKAI